MMISFTHDSALVDNHRTNQRVRARLPFSPSSKGKGTRHVEMSRFDGGHRRFEEVEDFLRGIDLGTTFFFTADFLAMVFLVVAFFMRVFFLTTGFVDLAIVVCFFLIDVFFFEV